MYHIIYIAICIIILSQHQNMFNNNYYDSNQNNQTNSLFTNPNPMNYRYNLF